MFKDDVDLIWQELSRIETCMMITQGSERDIRARPMVGIVERDTNTIWFVMNRQEKIGRDIRSDGRVYLTYTDATRESFLSIAGRGEVVEDHSRLREMWTNHFDSRFDGGPSDPDALLVAVKPEMAEYWDNPNMDLMAAMDVLTTPVASHHQPLAHSGETHKVDMKARGSSSHQGHH